jgi:hypothetical protein
MWLFNQNNCNSSSSLDVLFNQNNYNSSTSLDVLFLTVGVSIFLIGGYYSLIYTSKVLFFSSQILHNTFLINNIKNNIQSILKYFPTEFNVVNEEFVLINDAFKKALITLNNLSPDNLSSQNVLDLEFLLSHLKMSLKIIETDIVLIASHYRTTNQLSNQLLKNLVQHGLETIKDINCTLQKINTSVNNVELSQSTEQNTHSDELIVNNEDNSSLCQSNEQNQFSDELPLLFTLNDFFIVFQIISISTFFIFSFFLIKKQMVIFFPYFLCIFTTKITKVVIFFKFFFKKIYNLIKIYVK